MYDYKKPLLLGALAGEALYFLGLVSHSFVEVIVSALCDSLTLFQVVRFQLLFSLFSVKFTNV